MRIVSLLIMILLGTISLQAQTNRLVFQTDFGNIKVLLYDFTPRHRDLILQSVEDGVYMKSFFNRVIADFVVQGGEHDVDIANREGADPSGAKPRLGPEFDQRAFHKVGALGAGRDDNPAKASFLNQIYFVVGRPVLEKDLIQLEEKKGRKYTPEQWASYLKFGGQPRLDGDYTVFGEVYEGMDVLLEISKVKTDSLDYPVLPIEFKLIRLD
ncbi:MULTISPECIES: peptidylprolyl isomerase [Sphingobacterium]|uniref:peptidylprolyl isomerase n=1 Tax=Sphingobacterium TaxID=28453 RepID=UPI001F08D15C|nr:MULTISPECIES: peptidylprolyl isomerase [unclassified Sphingobacterium]